MDLRGQGLSRRALVNLLSTFSLSLFFLLLLACLLYIQGVARKLCFGFGEGTRQANFSQVKSELLSPLLGVAIRMGNKLTLSLSFYSFSCLVRLKDLFLPRKNAACFCCSTIALKSHSV